MINKQLPRLTAAVTLLAIVACGGEQKPADIAPGVRSYSCASGEALPPSRLIIPPANGVSGQWNVALMPDAVPLHEVAVRLAARHGGTIRDEWEAIHGFSIALDDGKARAMSEEPEVCFMEQNVMGSLPVLPGSGS